MRIEFKEVYEAQAARLCRHLEKRYGLTLSQNQGLNAIAIAVLGQRDWNHVLPLLPKSRESAPEPRICYWLPDFPRQDGHYYPSIVRENEPGHHGTDWDWGTDRALAQQLVNDRNKELGLSETDAEVIVGSSIAASSAYNSFLEEGLSEAEAEQATAKHMAKIREKYPNLRK